MKTWVRAVCTAAVVLFVATPARASAQQWQPSRPADPADVATIDAIIAAFYDVVSAGAGVQRDWTRDSTLYHPHTTFVMINRQADGRFAAERVTHGEFAASTDAGLSGGFFEHEIHRVTHQFGPMAQVFSTYEWSLTEGGPIGGRGINSIELWFDGTRWWITSAMWVSEDADNPIPAQYLPAS